jgi:hypothetical protein
MPPAWRSVSAKRNAVASRRQALRRSASSARREGRTFQCRLLCREETCDNEDAVREIHLNSCLTASTAAAP